MGPAAADEQAGLAPEAGVRAGAGWQRWEGHLLTAVALHGANPAVTDDRVENLCSSTQHSPVWPWRGECSALSGNQHQTPEPVELLARRSRS